MWWVVAFVAVAVLLPSGVSVPIAAAVVVGLVGSWWWARRVSDHLEVSCEVPQWANPDQEIEARVEIRSRSRLPAPWVELDVGFGMGLGRTVPFLEATNLTPHETVVRRVRLLCQRRGRHHVGPPRVRVGDVLGVAQTQVEAPAATHVTVFPRIVPLRRLGLPAHSPYVTVPSSSSLLSDPANISGVRDYEVGDPLTAIHWPATARTGALAVKQYERAEARDTVICLDLDPAGYPPAVLRDATEIAITVAASVLYHSIVNDKLPAGLVTSTWTRDATADVHHLPPSSDQTHLRRALELLALAEPRGRAGLESLLADLDSELAVGTTVLAVTGRLLPGVRAQLLRLHQRGAAVAAVVTTPETSDEPHAEAGLTVYRVADLPEVTRLAR